jgi:hypothetical protein
MTVGKLRGTGGVTVTEGGAQALDGAAGGLDEIVIPYPTLQVRATEILGLNPEF